MKKITLRLAGVLLAGLFCMPVWAQTILTATVPALALGSYSAQQPNGSGLVVGSINANGTFRTIINGANQYLMVVYPAAGSGYSTYPVGIDTSRGGTIDVTSQLTNSLPAQVSFGGGTSARSYPQYVAFGDSNTTAQGASISSNGYAALLASGQGVPLTNLAVAGDMACDGALRGVYAQTPATVFSPLYSYMIGTNEANSKGVGSYEAVYNNCLMAAAAWLGSPATQKYTGASFGSVPTNWTTDTTYATSGLKSTTNGASAVWPVTVPSSGTVAIWYRIIDGNGGAFTYQIDSGSTTVVNNFTSPAIATVNGTTQSIGIVFITGVTPGAHNINTAVASATGAGNIVGILAVGTPAVASQFSGPKVFVAGVLYQLGDADSAATAQYNSDVDADVSSLSAMGWGVSFVDVRSRIKGTAAEMFNTLHIGDLGHAELEQLFVQAVQPIGSFDQTYKATTFNSIVVSGSYTALVTDSVIFTNGANVSAPSGNLPGKTYFIYNYNSGATAVVFGSNLAPNTGTTVSSSGGGNWFHMDPSSIETAQFNYGLCTGGTFNASVTDAAIVQQGCTVSLPTTNVQGKTYFIANYSGSAFATLGGASSGNANGYVIPPNSGIIVTSSGPGAWWLVGGEFAGFTATATPGTNVTSATCTTASCTNLRGTLSIVGGTGTTGTIVALSWSPTPSAYVCTVTQNGGAVSYGIGNSVATTTGMNITAAVSVSGATVTVNYSCKK